MLRRWLGRFLIKQSSLRGVEAAVQCLRKAQALRGEGRHREALTMGQGGLALLRNRDVDRNAAAPSTALVGLTVLVEQLATELGVQGAQDADLRDSIASLSRHGAQGESPAGAAEYLEARLRDRRAR
jgi:hypothetical protein